MRQLALGVRLRAACGIRELLAGAERRDFVRPAGPSRDPLWLWGNRGCGKTHLLQAVCAAAGATAPGETPGNGGVLSVGSFG